MQNDLSAKGHYAVAKEVSFKPLASSARRPLQGTLAPMFAFGVSLVWFAKSIADMTSAVAV